ncbi:hypothetical protein [Iningainema tapete]|uniref:Uncharacterized protein n=1 Tax=Iningainema tapete BLCC-T55 TaxID=2748662 RepID=A0A8J6XFG8_9CYAN|nr:hypothetical protein [Iningainema tapete]MBD2772000.1 hypothetical protein [Iningainema tapete BLCC-T55]
MEFSQEQQRRTELVISQAKRENFTEQEKEFYDDFFAEAGIKKNLSEMTEQDADDLLQALSASECSLEFIANVVNRVAIEAPPYVVEHILYSDLDKAIL